MRLAIILLTIIIVINSITFYFYLNVRQRENLKSKYNIFDAYLKVRFYDKLLMFMNNHSEIKEVKINNLIFKREGNYIVVEEEQK
ncbi:hypothetical protein XO10_01255 [Marinitoga sp. 1135]|uniref:Uncharacterized protein n=1 Tax=Marinitoga piezophila (strain DSM 14283 / JCM 11233 / KA3) TaxID=443254 RepID=H2J3K0_MARPK|nr:MULTISPECIES: hypothetical protein [Marinitoga]AEX84644.1 hypothetical protein Marpi_0189 [Marinitoga piezophila KA3]APT75161.1 hypothetical protein LN42_01170 [Marinitoga sp. 1137]NUU94935.1 hypothetical protein [Marinitoga sp. 1135]NUU96888.1 hypothetical protein [Marinitoga sp. 1138]